MTNIRAEVLLKDLDITCEYYKDNSTENDKHTLQRLCNQYSVSLLRKDMDRLKLLTELINYQSEKIIKEESKTLQP